MANPVHCNKCDQDVGEAESFEEAQVVMEDHRPNCTGKDA